MAAQRAATQPEASDVAQGRDPKFAAQHVAWALVSLDP